MGCNKWAAGGNQTMPEIVLVIAQGRGVMEAIVKSLNQTDIVEGGSFTNKRQPIRSVPRLASPGALSMCLRQDQGSQYICCTS